MCCKFHLTQKMLYTYLDNEHILRPMVAKTTAFTHLVFTHQVMEQHYLCPPTTLYPPPGVCLYKIDSPLPLILANN